MPSDNKSLPEPILAEIYVTIWRQIGHNELKIIVLKGNLMLLGCGLNIVSGCPIESMSLYNGDYVSKQMMT